MRRVEKKLKKNKEVKEGEHSPFISVRPGLDCEKSPSRYMRRPLMMTQHEQQLSNLWVMMLRNEWGIISKNLPLPLITMATV